MSLDVTQNVAMSQSGGTLYLVAGNMPGGALGLGGPNLPLYFAFMPECNSITLLLTLAWWRKCHEEAGIEWVPTANIQTDHGKAECHSVAWFLHGLNALPGKLALKPSNVCVAVTRASRLAEELFG